MDFLIIILTFGGGAVKNLIVGRVTGNDEPELFMSRQVIADTLN